MQELFNKITRKNLENNLYIIPTPIGNLEDITFRALNILQNCDIIFCEDTRNTKKLLNLYDINNKILYTYNNYSDDNQRNNIINLIKNEKKSIALVSDAGTPLISDPGYKLVELCVKNAINIIPLPGASASITALSASGLSTDKFLFYGFLSANKNEKERELKNLVENNYTTICYETAIRLINTLEILNNIDKNKKICVARELTKVFETIKTDTVENVLSYYKNNKDKVRGEIVLIIEKKEETNKNEFSIDKTIIDKYLKYLSKKDAAELLADIYKLNKKIIYNYLIELE